MNRPIFVFAIIALAAAVPKPKVELQSMLRKPTLNAVGNTVTIEHGVSDFQGSTLTITCTKAKAVSVKLASNNNGNAILRVRNVDGCTAQSSGSTPSAGDTAITLNTDANPECATAEGDFFKWLIEVDETLTDGVQEFREISQVNVKCDLKLEDASKPDNEYKPEDEANIGAVAAEATETIEFELTGVSDGTDKWKFTLKPKTGVVGDRTFSIESCTATPQGETSPTKALIAGKCITDKRTTVIRTDNEFTITAAAFRFSAFPDKKVSLVCKPVLCAENDDACKGAINQCPP